MSISLNVKVRIGEYLIPRVWAGLINRAYKGEKVVESVEHWYEDEDEGQCLGDDGGEKMAQDPEKEYLHVLHRPEHAVDLEEVLRQEFGESQIAGHDGTGQLGFGFLKDVYGVTVCL